MSYNTRKTMTKQQRYCDKNKEKFPQKCRRYYEENKKRLHEMARDQYRGLSEEQNLRKQNTQEIDIIK